MTAGQLVEGETAVAKPRRRLWTGQVYRSDSVIVGRPGLLGTVADVWRSRELLIQFVLRDLRVRYKQAVMGFAWALFMPLLVVLAGLLVRYSMTQVAGDGVIGESSLVGLSVKALAWAFFVGAIGTATPSLIASRALVTKVFFPREVIPLSAVFAQLVDSSIGALVLLLVLPFLGATFTLQTLWLPLLVGLLVAFTMAASLVLSCANLFFRDVKYLVQTVLTFGIFLTPVFTDIHMFGPFGARLMMLNPLSPLLEGLRLSVAAGHNLLEPLTVLSRTGVAIVAWQPWYLLYSALWAVGGLFLSARIFRRASRTFAEYV